MDFELVLVVATFVSGLIWLIDRLVFRPKRRARLAAETQQLGVEAGIGGRGAQDHEPLLVDYAKSFFPILLAVLVIRSFLFEPFRIPSGSMMPTLLIGDFILVNKFTYGLRLPVVNTKVLPIGEPERGDVAVFRYPQQPEVDYIKRIVGLPGDTVRVDDQRLWINGEPVSLETTGRYDGDANLKHAGLTTAVETLPEDEPHRILMDTDRRLGAAEWTVPEGQYFVMGDNRNHSNDSRFWGTVPESNLVGKAVMIWMHWNWQDGGFDAGRIGRSIDTVHAD
ncbi:signal peptidase I [Guyparkeria halopsychrophila]|uniref:signal peptidase I n=1 Tax=Guyparkeria halopsychrophila TaxID=3139421 RepID=UPI0037C63BFC